MIESWQIQEINESIDELLYRIYEESIYSEPKNTSSRIATLADACSVLYNIEIIEFFRMVDERIDLWGNVDKEFDKIITFANIIISNGKTN